MGIGHHESLRPETLTLIATPLLNLPQNNLTSTCAIASFFPPSPSQQPAATPPPTSGLQKEKFAFPLRDPNPTAMTTPSAQAASAPPPSSIRLHITPLDPDLLTVVLSSTLLPKATNISYHALDTFPEKRYGFLNLPADDAEKLRKRLNGAVVKGYKLRVQTAREEKLPTVIGDDAMGKSKTEKKEEGVKKRKRDDHAVVLEGVQLEEGRKVKRGWTAAAGEEAQDKDRRARKEKGGGEKKDKKEKKARRQEKSKFTEHEECLVKTVLPANAVPAEEGGAGAAVSKSKKKRNAREVVVHEFERTTKFPTFLKTTVAAPGTKPELEFVEGKGWVDEAGVVVEPVKARPVTRSKAPIFKKKVPVPESNSSSSSGTDDSEEDASDAESTSASPIPKAAGKGKPVQTKDSTPSSPQSDTPHPKSSDSPKNLSIRIPPATPAKDGKVHPLEALYKRPAPADGTAAAAEPEQPSEKPFSFFANNDDDASASDGEAAAAAPNEEVDVPKTTQALMMTPFTRRDIETRGIRSAAPTPDTAHPSRRFKPWDDDAAADGIAEDGEDEDEEMAVGEGSPSGKATRAVVEGEGAAATSDFQKWFWENRGDINRSWKKRRKQAGKEKRYRENRARMARAI